MFFTVLFWTFLFSLLCFNFSNGIKCIYVCKEYINCIKIGVLNFEIRKD